MVLDLTPASIELLLELQAYILKWGYRSVPSNHMVCQAYFIYCSVMCLCFSLSLTMECCQESGLLSISMLKVIQIFAVLYLIKKNKDGHVHVGKKKEEEWIIKNTIMLVNFIHKLVCFIGFIATMTIVKRNLGNDKSPNSSPISSNEKKERKN